MNQKLKGVYCESCGGPVDCLSGECILNEPDKELLSHSSGWVPCPTCNKNQARNDGVSRDPCNTCNDFWLVPE